MKETVFINRTKVDKFEWDRARNNAKKLSEADQSKYREMLGRMVSHGLRIINNYTEKRLRNSESG